MTVVFFSVNSEMIKFHLATLVAYIDKITSIPFILKTLACTKRMSLLQPRALALQTPHSLVWNGSTSTSYSFIYTGPIMFYLSGPMCYHIVE